ncbi:MAG: hypothetical protein GXP29_07170 [Planctomycetes bacterium]|nr:hypothetical protein [Planctomycetota bacterium]
MKIKHKQVIGVLAMLSIAVVVLSKSAAEAANEGAADAGQAISSKIEVTKAGELILVETVIIAAPVAKVWDAYTTSSGYTAWAAPVAEIDCRVGGLMRTHYDPKAKIGDPQTITSRIVNYVPQKMLTLKADVSENWPEILKSQAEHLYNVILFEEVAKNKTRIVSYGLGYRDNKEMRGMLDFFVEANKGLYAKLIKAVE